MQLEKSNQFSQKISDIDKSINSLEAYLNETNGKISLLSKQREDVYQCIKRSEETIQLANDSISILNSVSFEIRNKYIKKIEDLVTLALQEVFVEKDIRLSLSLSTDSVRNNIKMCVVENGHEYNIMKSRGGGLADLISIAIQICIKNMLNPKKTFPILLDERFKFLHSQNSENDYIFRAYLFLRKVCEKLDEQVVAITGEEDFACNDSFKNLVNKTFYVKHNSGESKVQEGV